MSATISRSGRIFDWSLAIGRERGRAISNDWRKSMARSVVGNRETSGSDHRPIVRSSCDRLHDQSWHPATDRTINRRVRRRNERPIVASATDSTIDRTTVAKSCDKSGQFASNRSTDHDVIGRKTQPIARWHDQLYDQSSHCVFRDHPQLVVRPRETSGTIT